MSSIPSLPVCPGVDKSFPGADWNREHKRWLAATVWAAQEAAIEHLKYNNVSTDGLLRCAACAANIPSSEKSKCSRCKLVYFCDKTCQRAAHPIHKHCCQPVEPVGLTAHRGRMQQKLHEFWEETGAYDDMKKNIFKPASSTEQRWRCGFHALACGQKWMEESSEQALKAFDRAMQMGKELQEWTLQSEAYKGIVVCCMQLAPTAMKRNLKYYDDALTAAIAHGDLYLEALAVKQIGIEAALHYRDASVLRRSYELWLALIWACRRRGQVAKQPMATCAMHASMALGFMVDTMNVRDKDVAPVAERLLREALLYADMAPYEYPYWPHRWMALCKLANMCQLNKYTLEPDGQDWLNRAAIYRQHAVRLAAKMGATVVGACGHCNKLIDFSKPTTLASVHETCMTMNACGHFQHVVCQGRAIDAGQTGCATCHKGIPGSDLVFKTHGCDLNCHK